MSVVVVKKGRGSKVGGGNAHDGCWKFGLVCTFNGDMIREDFHAVTKTYCNWGGSSQATYVDSNVCVYMQFSINAMDQFLWLWVTDMGNNKCPQ